MKNINFGIDLGTTNSGIGKYENGKVQVLKNPVGLGETLPSVVSFYRGRTLVGNKAREQYLSNAGNVFSAFKRKMGTGEQYKITQQEQSTDISPVDLSAYVLKELKNYVQGDDVEAAVITIPASFDTIQSNATKTAGYQAGFKQVLLLQEPIAACLAYANLSHLNIEKEQQWLVYDFGGGTFDVALVYINHRELKVLDNKGNNFLGGIDIDHAFIASIIVPKLNSLVNEQDLWGKLTSREGVYEKFWYYLNYLAEEAKKELSLSPSTWIEIDFPELDILLEIEVKQDDIDQAVKPKYQESEQFILELLAENSLSFKDIDRIILVGGTTYIPFIKNSLRALGTVVDDSIDPTTAVIVGAAYYAGTCPLTIAPEPKEKTTTKFDVKLSFEAYSNDKEELIAFKIPQPFEGFYRITRSDGGFDSGLLEFSQTASEFVTLLPKTKNTFRLIISDRNQNEVFETNDISISQGLYSVSGQLLPEDICIELDKDDNTYLDVIFNRNSILPLSKTLYKTFSKSIIKNSDDKVIINLVEGKSGTMPGSNLSIGYIEISGQQINSDLIQGTDIEIELEMDESRGLKVDVFIPSTGQQISQSFHIATRDVSVEKMLQDINMAEVMLGKEIAKSDQEEVYELSAMFQKIGKQLQDLKLLITAIQTDQVTEEKYRLDERKRKLLGELDSLTRARDVFIETNKYRLEKEKYISLQEHANEGQKNAVKQIFDREKEFLLSADKHLIQHKTLELEKINAKVALQNNEIYIGLFWTISSMPEQCFKDTSNIETLIESGKKAVDDRDFLQLKHIVAVLFNKLDDQYKSKKPVEEHIQYVNKTQTFKTGLK